MRALGNPSVMVSKLPVTMGVTPCPGMGQTCRSPMRATGMPDGQYTLGGLDVAVAGNRATLVSDGALAGSVTNLMDCMRTAVKEMQVPLEIAVACATMNPAKSLGIYDQYGSITPGKKADLVLLDENLELKAVFKDGIRLEI